LEGKNDKKKRERKEVKGRGVKELGKEGSM
jgi:hypothetical protein